MKPGENEEGTSPNHHRIRAIKHSRINFKSLSVAIEEFDVVGDEDIDENDVYTIFILLLYCFDKTRVIFL